MTHIISHEHLSLGRLKEIIENHERVELGPEAVAAIEKCRKYLDSKMEDIGRPVYGVTTGFGSLCNVTIPADQLSQLQHNLVMSHACGTGETVRPQIVRLMLLLKAQSLSYGHSGAQLITVQRLLDMFNNDILPVVYQQGSLGASGDLAPLAHLSLPLIGLGEVLYKGKVRPSKEVWDEMGWEPISLQSKEGLALLNGTQFMSAHAIWSLIQCHRLSEWADRIGAMSLEAYDGRVEPFLPLTHQLRPHKGQIDTAARFMTLLDGSELVRNHKEHVQDPYSFRCIPQVHGAVKDSIRYVESVIENEINSATDNPNVYPDEDMIISAGNFHGEPIAIPMDALAIAMSELANISERRIYRLISGQRGLPKFLVHPWPQQRIYDPAVHGGLDREPEQGTLLAGVSGLHPILTGSGGSRQHGFQRRDKTCARHRQLRGSACHRTVQRRTGARLQAPDRRQQVLGGHRGHIQ